MNKKVASGLFWKLLENGGSQAVQFVVSVILARLLSPREYTVIAIIMIFTTIANVLVQNGFATALIQRKDADGVDFSSVFFLNLFSSLVVYIFMFLLSPVIARFFQGQLFPYKMPMWQRRWSFEAYLFRHCLRPSFQEASASLWR